MIIFRTKHYALLELKPSERPRVCWNNMYMKHVKDLFGRFSQENFANPANAHERFGNFIRKTTPNIPLGIKLWNVILSSKQQAASSLPLPLARASATNNNGSVFPPASQPFFLIMVPRMVHTKIATPLQQPPGARPQ